VLEERRVIVVDAEHEPHAVDAVLGGCLNRNRSVWSLHGADDLGALLGTNCSCEDTVAEAPGRVGGVAR
jgi:hypothetical protein